MPQPSQPDMLPIATAVWSSSRGTATSMTTAEAAAMAYELADAVQAEVKRQEDRKKKQEEEKKQSEAQQEEAMAHAAY